MSRVTKRVTKKSSSAEKKSLATGRAKAQGAAKAVAENIEAEEHLDGCDCEFSASEATADADLPVAKGGVEITRAKLSRAKVRGGRR